MIAYVQTAKRSRSDTFLIPMDSGADSISDMTCSQCTVTELHARVQLLEGSRNVVKVEVISQLEILL